MSAREEILQRVRAGLGKGDAGTRRAAAEALLAAPRRGPQPAIAGDLAARFADKAASLASTVDRVATPSEAPVAAVRYLAANGLPLAAVATADVGGLDWAGAGLEISVRAAVDADTTGITGCFCAIAETGTLLLLSGPDTPASVSLLPETHIAVVPVARIVATMEDAFALLRAERPGTLPRAVNFISGPSRTGDIEQTIVLGAHGPCRVHLILSGDTP
jgi:L-lactate dehydrogenase complex protein LldG